MMDMTPDAREELGEVLQLLYEAEDRSAGPIPEERRENLTDARKRLERVLGARE